MIKASELVRNVARTEQIKKVIKHFIRKKFEDLSVNGWIILKQVLHIGLSVIRVILANDVMKQAFVKSNKS
jgi:hypothetical protein